MIISTFTLSGLAGHNQAFEFEFVSSISSPNNLLPCTARAF